ncbi:hypothetical protein Unana1_00467 [Umbelopsis nana]
MDALGDYFRKSASTIRRYPGKATAKGVMDAVKRRYLESVVVIVHSSAVVQDQDFEGEQFEFSVTYYSDQKGEEGVLAKAIAYLSHYLQKMEPLADNQYLSVKLVYSDITPLPYKPPSFQQVQFLSFTPPSKQPIFQLKTGDPYQYDISA